jgi:chromosome partitioning protein
MITALTNQKGGVGKSTIAVHAAVWLAEVRNIKVALVDSDAQNSSTQWLKEAAPQIPVFRLATSDDLLEELPKLRKEFDHIIVDAPGSLAEATRSVLFHADLALMPCGPSILDLRASHDSIRVLREVQGIRGGPPKAILIPNKLQIQYRLSREFLETTAALEIPTGSALRLRQSYADAVGQGTVVWKMGKGARDATQEIQKLFSEVFTNVDASNTDSTETLDDSSDVGNLTAA